MKSINEINQKTEEGQLLMGVINYLGTHGYPMEPNLILEHVHKMRDAWITLSNAGPGDINKMNACAKGKEIFFHDIKTDTDEGGLLVAAIALIMDIERQLTPDGVITLLLSRIRKNSQPMCSVKSTAPTFVQELQTLINRHSLENESDTPDFVLANFISNIMPAFTVAALERDKFFGFKPWDKKETTEKVELFQSGQLFTDSMENDNIPIDRVYMLSVPTVGNTALLRRIGQGENDKNTFPITLKNSGIVTRDDIPMTYRKITGDIRLIVFSK